MSDNETGTTETYETARLAADVVALAERNGQIFVLLIKRGWPPHEGLWALPGGHVDPGEHDIDTAARELREETGLDVTTADLTEVGTYRAPGRDPRGRYVSFAWLAVLDRPTTPTAGDDASDAHWWPVDQLLREPERLAFDHAQILRDAIAHIRRPNTAHTTMTTTTVVSGNARVAEVVGVRFEGGQL